MDSTFLPGEELIWKRDGFSERVTYERPGPSPHRATQNAGSAGARCSCGALIGPSHPQPTALVRRVFNGREREVPVAELSRPPDARAAPSHALRLGGTGGLQP